MRKAIRKRKRKNPKVFRRGNTAPESEWGCDNYCSYRQSGGKRGGLVRLVGLEE
jgi:hypothetical protein